MRKKGKRVLIVLTVLASILAMLGVFWISLTHKPEFYRTVAKGSPEQRKRQAKRFVAQSLQLRNDIYNEPSWEAIFSDEEVNAWLAQDLVQEFADELPPEVHEPRVLFELDSVTLAFELDRGAFSTVIWVVAHPNVPEPNVLELTLEKIRAGVLPVPPENILDRIIAHVRSKGLEASWKRVDGLPVVQFKYTPHLERDDVRLEEVGVRDGQIRLAGHSSRSKGLIEPPTLPTRKVLQSKFPRRKLQEQPASVEPPSTIIRKVTVPMS
ncbi:hypothetical protein [Singulisphaera sp. PoT]|uniref:hypothetical protein n=1 Tax=Singulisphaera sp. PoT TaxID=3411797 RepID=UPI003BF59238